MRNLNLKPKGTAPYWQRMVYNATGQLYTHESSQIFSSALWAAHETVNGEVLRGALQSLPIDPPASGLPLNPTYAGVAKQIHSEAKAKGTVEGAAALAQAFIDYGFFDTVDGPSEALVAAAQENNERQAWIAWRNYLKSPTGTTWRADDDGFYWNAFVQSQPGTTWLNQVLTTLDPSTNTSRPWAEAPAVIYPHEHWNSWMQSPEGLAWLDANVREIWQGFSQVLLSELMTSSMVRDFIAKTWREFIDYGCVSSNVEKKHHMPPKSNGNRDTLCSNTPNIPYGAWRSFFQESWQLMLESDEGFGAFINKAQIEALLDQAWQKLVAANQDKLVQANWRWALLSAAGWKLFGSAESWALLVRGAWGSYVKNPDYGYNTLIGSTDWQGMLDELYNDLNSSASMDIYGDEALWQEGFIKPWWSGDLATGLVWTGGWWDTAAQQLYDPDSESWRFWGSWWTVWRGGWDSETDPDTGENTNTYTQWGSWWSGYLVFTGGWWTYSLTDPAGTPPPTTQPWQLWGSWWSGYLVFTGGWWDIAHPDGSGGVITEGDGGFIASLAGAQQDLESSLGDLLTSGVLHSSGQEDFGKENQGKWLNEPADLDLSGKPTLTINRQLPIVANVGKTVSFKLTATSPGSTTQPVIQGYNLPKHSVFNRNMSKATYKYTPPADLQGSSTTLFFSASNASGTTELQVEIIYQ